MTHMPMHPLTEGRPGSSPRFIASVQPAQLAALDALAKRRSVSRSEVVREAVALLLASEPEPAN
jgi:hypothetical protein